jgi:hypothetical protein
MATNIPTLGQHGFQTFWLEDKGLALWHDGASVQFNSEEQKLNKLHTVATRRARADVGTGKRTGGILQEEHQSSRAIAEDLIDLYSKRVNYSLTVFPFLGHQHPHLNVVFDSQQSVRDLVNFDIGLHASDGTLLGSRPFRFNGPLQTLDFNLLFAEQLAELTQGYWTITADPKNQAPDQDLDNLHYPNNQVLFGFWGDSSRLFDSVHSLSTENRVSFDLGQSGNSEMARASGRLVSRCRKFAPLVADKGETSWYWVCNVGNSHEAIDANVKFRLFLMDGSEQVLQFRLPANSTRILSSNEILAHHGTNRAKGTVWLESNDCNLGAMWFMQTAEGKGFAVDHFTGA